MLNSNTEPIPNWYLATPAGQEAHDAAQQHARATRQGLVDQLDALKRELTEMTDTHNRRIDSLDEAARAAKDAYETATDLLREGHQARAAAIRAIQSRILPVERDLIAGADPRINATKVAVGVRFERERHAIARSQEIPTGRINRETGGREMRTLTNAGAVRRVIDALGMARIALDELRLVNPDDLDAAIASIMRPVEAAWAVVRELDGNDPQAT